MPHDQAIQIRFSHRAALLASYRHSDRRRHLEGRPIQLVGTAPVTGLAALDEHDRQVVLAVGRPWSGTHGLVHGDGGLEMADRRIQVPEDRSQPPDVAIDRADAALGVPDGVSAYERLNEKNTAVGQVKDKLKSFGNLFRITR